MKPLLDTQCWLAGMVLLTGDRQLEPYDIASVGEWNRYPA